MERLKFDELELRRRLAFFELGDKDFKRLDSLKQFAEKHKNGITEDLYSLILGHEESRAFFPDDESVRRVKVAQNRYFSGLFSGTYDLRYVEERLKVGATHERLGMPPKLYLGAYRRYLKLICDRLVEDFKDPGEVVGNLDSIRKIIMFDMSLAIDTYIVSHLDTVTRQKIAIRELSTPVIKVHDGVLLLPLVGTIDTQRAQQITETVLSRVVDEQAKVIIIDIAGVQVVDTKVADHLLKTTAAVKLLGAQTILTGISARVAQTMVQLGVDISTMYTRTQLSDGIELALKFIGRRIDKIGED